MSPLDKNWAIEEQRGAESEHGNAAEIRIVRTSRYEGIGGWLFLFCINLTIVNPLLCLGYSIQTAGNLRGSPVWVRILVISPLLVLATLSVHAGMALWRVRPNSVTLAKRFLTAFLVLSFITSGVVFWNVMSSGAPEDVAAAPRALGLAFANLFLAVAYIQVWYSYLNKSRRVAATYLAPKTPSFDAASGHSNTSTTTENRPVQGQPLRAWMQLANPRFLSVQARQAFAAPAIAFRSQVAQLNQGMFPIRRDHIVWLFIVPATLAWAWLVWPTPYRFERVKIASLDFFLRVHRLTGKTEILDPNDGWRAVQEERVRHELSPKELSNLKGQATLGWDGEFKVVLYNGSEWQVQGIAVKITIRQKPSRSTWLKKKDEDFRTLIQDPDFLKLPFKPQREVLLYVFPDFARMPTTVQDRALSLISNGNASTLFPLQPFSRLYRLTGYAAPYAVSEFSANLDFIPCPDQSWDWAIAEAQGMPR